jgi:hypothetical protein
MCGDADKSTFAPPGGAHNSQSIAGAVETGWSAGSAVVSCVLVVDYQPSNGRAGITRAAVSIRSRGLGRLPAHLAESLAKGDNDGRLCGTIAWIFAVRERNPVVKTWFTMLVCLAVTGCDSWLKSGKAPPARSNRPYAPPPVVFDGDSIGLRRTVVVPTLDTPIPDGKNVIWCASFPMAWDRLKNDVIGEPIRLAKAEEVAGRLNKTSVADGDLPEGSFYAAAGYTKDGIAEKIRREMQKRFQKEPTGLDDKDAAILAYAYLRANVTFTLPFYENDAAFDFADGQGQKTGVSSFGLRAQNYPKDSALRQQVDVLYLHKEGMWGQPTEFALDLCRDSNPNQVILASIPRKATLLEVLKDLDRKRAECQPDEQDRHPHSDLLVPNLNWKISHHFAELEGTEILNPRSKGLWIGTALESIDFRLDRSGVELQAESRLVAKAAVPCYFFDRPFLIIVQKRGADRPFFAMWVDNAELLCKP